MHWNHENLRNLTRTYLKIAHTNKVATLFSNLLFTPITCPPWAKLAPGKLTAFPPSLVVMEGTSIMKDQLSSTHLFRAQCIIWVKRAYCEQSRSVTYCSVRLKAGYIICIAVSPWLFRLKSAPHAISSCIMSSDVLNLSPESQQHLDNIRIVLVNSSHPGNIGGVAER